MATEREVQDGTADAVDLFQLEESNEEESVEKVPPLAADTGYASCNSEDQDTGSAV